MSTCRARARRLQTLTVQMKYRYTASYASVAGSAFSACEAVNWWFGSDLREIGLFSDLTVRVHRCTHFSGGGHRSWPAAARRCPQPGTEARGEESVRGRWPPRRKRRDYGVTAEEIARRGDAEFEPSFEALKEGVDAGWAARAPWEAAIVAGVRAVVEFAIDEPAP